MKDFNWVDIHRADAKTHYPWLRVHVDKVPEIVNKYVNTEVNLYSTLQRFDNPEHQDNEIEYCPLAFDFDCSTDIEKSYADCKVVVNYFVEYGLGISPEEMMTYFSGNRGFHIVINAEIFGAEPMIDMNKVWRVLVTHLNKEWKIPTTGDNKLDISTYIRRKAWRIPNTKHLKTGLYKRALTFDELMSGVNNIKELAKESCGWISLVEVI